MADNTALATVLTPTAFADELEGFTFVPSDGIPFITLDNQRRFYFNASLRKMFGLQAYSKIALGYNADTKSIAIITKNVEAVPGNFAYMLDKRHYASARKFVADFKIDIDKAPFTYVFDRGTSVKGVYIFRLASEAPIDAEIVEDTPPVNTVRLDEAGRLHFSDFEDVELYVNYNGKTRQLEVSTEHRPHAYRTLVGTDGLTGPSIDAVENAYKRSRPVTFALVEERADGVRIYRKQR